MDTAIWTFCTEYDNLGISNDGTEGYFPGLTFTWYTQSLPSCRFG